MLCFIFLYYLIIYHNIIHSQKTLLTKIDTKKNQYNKLCQLKYNELHNIHNLCDHSNKNMNQYKYMNQYNGNRLIIQYDNPLEYDYNKFLLLINHGNIYKDKKYSNVQEIIIKISNALERSSGELISR